MAVVNEKQCVDTGLMIDITLVGQLMLSYGNLVNILVNVDWKVDLKTDLHMELPSLSPSPTTNGFQKYNTIGRVTYSLS